MAASVIVDAGFVVALLSSRDTHHRWALAHASRLESPWQTCEAALSEIFHLVGAAGSDAVIALLRRRCLSVAFNLGMELDYVLKLMQKYSDVPMSLADACLVRMSETFPESILLTTDSDFRIYRRYGRNVVPCVTPR